MKKFFAFWLFVTLFGVTNVRADEPPYGYGTVFGGLGALNHSVEIGHFGAGGGVVYGSGIGFSGEAGYIFAFGDTEGVIVGDINANYHFLNATRTKELVPFLSSGYSWFVPDGHQFNCGGGIDYWIKPQTGIRFEVRDHLFGEDHAIGIRAAFIFR